MPTGARPPSLMDSHVRRPVARGDGGGSRRLRGARPRLEIRYGCRWESTRPRGRRLRARHVRRRVPVPRGECSRSAVTESVEGSHPRRRAGRALRRHGDPAPYRGRSVFIVGKRNSGFEVASGLLAWAARIVLASPRPVDTTQIGRSPVRARYLQPLDEYARGGASAYVVDATIERIERKDGGFRVVAPGRRGPRALLRDGRRAPGDRVPDATSGSARARARNRRRRPDPGADALLRERLRAGHLLRRERVVGLSRVRKQGLGSNSTRSTASATTHASWCGASPRRASASASNGRCSDRSTCCRTCCTNSRSHPSSGCRRGFWPVSSASTGRSETRGSCRLSSSSTRPGRMRSSGRRDGPRREIHPSVYIRSSSRLIEAALPAHPTRSFDSEQHRRELATLLELVG